MSRQPSILLAVPLMTVVAGTVATSPADAAIIRFCIKHTGSFNDNNFGEDRWTDDDPKAALGQAVQIFRWGAQDPLWEGNLTTNMSSPGQGCTAALDVASPNGDYSIWVASEGVVEGYPIEVWDATGGSPFIRVAWTPYSISDNGALGKYPVDLIISTGTDTWNAFNIYLAVAYGLWRNPGPAPGSLYKVNVVDEGGGYGSGTGTIAINSGWSKRKFEILHEAGHRSADLATQGVMNSAQSYLWYDPACPRDLAGTTNFCDTDGDKLEDGGLGGVTVPGDCSGACLPPNCPPKHAMRSMEYVGSAAGEGFAHFFAAAAWNNETELDCIFRYYVTLQIPPSNTKTVDCESAATGQPRRYMRTTCDPDDFVGHGVELDWLRAYWDMRTNPNTFGDPPSFIEMVTWLDHTPAWEKWTAYANLDAQANLEGFRLNYAWDTAKAGNGL